MIDSGTLLLIKWVGLWVGAEQHGIVFAEYEEMGIQHPFYVNALIS